MTDSPGTDKTQPASLAERLLWDKTEPFGEERARERAGDLLPELAAVVERAERLAYLRAEYLPNVEHHADDYADEIDALGAALQALRDTMGPA